MYKLSRFFVSDIVAGENILRNGYFPILKKNSQADHGIIVAANGSCKTTLLSFLFSVFAPDRRRFVQYLQSNGDKSLEQYLVPGRPAVVMLDLSINLTPTLFDAKPREHLVIGQLLYRDKSAPDKIRRSYFIAKSDAAGSGAQAANFFDGLRLQWEDLSRSNTPHGAVKEYLNDKVLQTDNQTEWAEKLESLGLDPWLVNRQVDFSRSEGGIKDSFKFKSEAEFLSFFLGCVSDLDGAMAIRKNTAQTIDKMKNRPEKKKQLAAVISLKKNLEKFHETGREWRSVHREMEETLIQLGEAVHLLTSAKKEADLALEGSDSALRKNRERQKQVKTDLETAQANQVKIEEISHAREVSELKRLIKEADRQLKTCEDERLALKASDLMALLRQLKAEAESREKALAGKDSQLEPARQETDLRAAQYHVRLGSQRMETESAIGSMEKEQLAEEKKHEALKAELREQEKKIAALNETLTRLSAQINAARMARDNIGLAPGEEPRESLAELERQIHDGGEKLLLTTARLRETGERQQQIQPRFQELHRSRIQAEEELKQIRKCMADEKLKRENLLGDAHLISIAGSASFDPTLADLATRLGESIARSRTRTEDLQEQLLGMKNELKRLENMSSLMVDSQVSKFVSHCISQGLSGSEVKPFLDYLSALDKTPEEIAMVVEGDPGRFTGIMALSDGVIKKIQDLPVPDWLHKPVVISTPLDMEKEPGRKLTVITPKDPMVYSKTYLEDQKKSLNRQCEKLRAQVSERISRIRSMEATETRLREYRQQYPDLVAVEALSRNLEAAKKNLDAMPSEILALEKEMDAHNAAKKELEVIFHRETRHLARLEEVVKQVKNWLSQYGEMDAWEKDLSGGEIKRLEMKHVAMQILENEKQSAETLTRLHGTLAGKRAELKNLEDRADDIPATDGLALTESQVQEALSMDLSALRRQYEQTQSNAIRIASELGIDGLRNDLQRVKQILQKTANDLERYRSKNTFDEEFARLWATKSSRDRDERTAILSATLEELKEQRASQRGKLEGRERDLVRCRSELKSLSGRGINGDIDPRDLENTDLDGLILHYKDLAAAREEKLNGLKQNGMQRAAELEKHRRWVNELELGLATVSGHSPFWDSLSPRRQWQALVRGEDPVKNALLFRDGMKTLLNTRKEMEAFMESSRKNMGRAFDQLKGELKDDTLKRQLPAIVDELSRHDAESLGGQSGELMEKCNHIAANIESDLSRSARFVESLVDQLFQHVRVAYQKLQTASKQLMPDSVFVYGGKPILKSGTRLDFTRHTMIYRKTIDNWLDELIEKNHVPEVSAKAGDTLAMELLYRLLKVSSAKQEFGIRLLKCDDTGRNYEPVGKDLGSGGEALTTAVLLYSLLTSMRQRRRNKKDDRLPAFLIADNPLGVCNRSDFLDTQLKVARAMGIQCIYFTGINDRESLGLFQHRMAIRHSGGNIQVGGKPYNSLEVIEQNVEEV